VPVKVWDYVYCYTADGNYTEVECHEQPWWAVLRSAWWHKYVCMHTKAEWVDWKCVEYDEARRKRLHVLKVI
jgi:hypothetical protein